MNNLNKKCTFCEMAGYYLSQREDMLKIELITFYINSKDDLNNWNVSKYYIRNQMSFIVVAWENSNFLSCERQ